MTSQYKQRLLPGEKEIADKLRPLVEPLRKQYDTKEEQAICLQELGELYLNAGIESRNGKDFTKAAALFNAALVRTSKEEIQKKIKERLVVVRQSFMTAFFPDVRLILQEQWEEIKMHNIHTLEKIRTNIKDNSRSLKLLMNRYDIEAKNVLEMETCLVNEAGKVTLLVQEEMLEFIRLLWSQSIEFSKGSPPCKYSMIGLGSLARQEVTPYSDLEFAILVGEKSDDVQRYFENLTNLFNLSVLDLGETPIPQKAISSLNDFMTPGGDWFYDKVTPSGFKLDGEMPWACKTPTGRQATPNKRGLSFIQTPVEMAELLKDDSVLGQSYHVSEVLRRTIHIIGDLDLYDIYQKEVIKIPHGVDTHPLGNKGINVITDILGETHTKDKPYHNAKLTYYRLPSTFVEIMRQWLTPSFQGGSQWCIIENFTKKQKLSKEDAFQLKLVIALAYGVRLFTYFSHKGQREKIEKNQLFGKALLKSIEIKLRLHFRRFIWRICLTNLPKYHSLSILEKLKTLHNYPRDLNIKITADPVTQILELMKDLHYVPPRGYRSLLNCYFKSYFTLAFEDQSQSGLHCSLYCSDTCLMSKVFDLDCHKPNIADFDYLLENTHLCACVSMMKMYLKVHKYCTQRMLKLPTGPPDVYLNCILDELSKCTKLRNELFLVFNLLKQAYFCKDVTLLKRVVKCVEEFLNTMVPRLTKVEIYKGVFHQMEFDFYRWLMHIYEFLGEWEKLTKLLEQWVNILETYHPGGDFDIEYIGIYTELGKALLRKPETEEEAIHLYKKALQRLEKKVSSSSSIDILAKSVLTFAEMLINKRRFLKEGEALLQEYFFNDNKSFNFTNDHIIMALLMLAYCYKFSMRWMECTEVCEKIYIMLKDEVNNDYPINNRSIIGNFLRLTYISRGNIIDLPKAAECHKLACNTQKDKVLAVVEHNIFLLRSSLCLFADGFKFMGIHYVIQAFDLDPKTHTRKLDFSRTDMWLHILVVLCDALNSFRHSVSIVFLFDNYNDIAHSLRKLSKFYKTRLGVYQIYLDYTLCYCLFSIAMDPDKSFVLKLKETTDYLYQTQTRLTELFPLCTAAIKWCQHARLLLNPNAEYMIIPQGYIDPSSLINKTQVYAYTLRLEEDPF